MSFYFKLGDKFYFKGLKYVVMLLDEPGSINATCLKDLRVVTFRIEELLLDNSFQYIGKTEEQPKTETNVIELSDKTQEWIRKKEVALEPLLLIYEALLGDDMSLRFLFAKFPDLFPNGIGELPNISQVVRLQAVKVHRTERTIWEWLKAFRTSGRSALIPRKRKNPIEGKIIRILDPQTQDTIASIKVRKKTARQIEVVEEVILNNYLTLNCPDPTEVVDIIERRLIKIKESPIPRRTLYHIISQIEVRIRTRFREGQREFQNKHEFINEGSSNEEAQYPLHIIEGDNAFLQIWVYDEFGILYASLPCLTIGVDKFSRLVWSLDLSIESPSSEKVKRFLENGLLPKRFGGGEPAYEETVVIPQDGDVNTANKWLCCGLPQEFLFDNGSDFDSDEVKRVIKEVLGKECRYCPPGKPETKPVVERLIRTIKNFIKRLPGSFEKTDSSRERLRAKKEACLTLEQLKGILIRFLVDIYPQKNHRGLPDETPTPLQRWIDGVKVSGSPEMMTQSEVRAALFGFLPEKQKPVTRYGIRHERITYRSIEIRAFIGDQKKHRVKFDPDDVSVCYLLDEKNERWIPVWAYKPSFRILTGKNIYYWKRVIRKTNGIRKQKLMEINDSTALTAMDEIDQEVRTARAKRKRVTREEEKLRKEGTQKTPANANGAEKPKSIVERLEDLEWE